jgi:hypothetical protein
MEELQNNLGGIESPKDERDFLGTGKDTPVPSEFLPDYSNLPVYNQLAGPGGQSACGGASGAKFQNILLGLGNELSWRFVYALAAKLTGLPPENGVYGRSIMQVLQRCGVPKAEFFPNDTSLSIAEFADWTKIPQAAYVDALSRRIGPYAQLTDLSPQGLRTAVYHDKAALVLKAPWQPSSWYPFPSNSGHFNNLTGFTPTKTRFANSFGNAWGVLANGGGNGDGFYLDSDLATIKEAWVAWEPTVDVPLPTPIPADPLQKRNWILDRIALLKSYLPFFK